MTLHAPLLEDSAHYKKFELVLSLFWCCRCSSSNFFLSPYSVNSDNHSPLFLSDIDNVESIKCVKTCVISLTMMTFHSVNYWLSMLLLTGFHLVVRIIPQCPFSFTCWESLLNSYSIWRDRSDYYPDLIIKHCMHILNYHNVHHKVVKNYVTKNTGILFLWCLLRSIEPVK